MQSALRDDALASTDSGFSVRVGLPWIRSLRLACVREPRVFIDGRPTHALRLVLGTTTLDPDALLDRDGWWFAQDRLVLVADGPLAAGHHDVLVTFRLLIPYLLAGPGGGPLELPIRIERRLQLDHPAVASVSLDVT